MQVWIFGYGSLVWRPAFAFAERSPAYVEGWARRFWQGSTDHRGVPAAPGRVVTLTPEPGARCWGMAYRVEAEVAESVLAGLDHREKGGYARLELEIGFEDPARAKADGLVYVATSGNPNYLGPAPLAAIAAQVARARGPSGSNREYVLELAAALDRLPVPDAHVAALARLLSDDAER